MRPAAACPVWSRVDIHYLAEGPFGCGSPRRLLILWVVSERDTGEDLARTIARLRRSKPLSGAERDAAGATVGAVLRNVGAPLSLETKPEARELGVPGKRLALPLAQIQGANGLRIQLQLHG